MRTPEASQHRHSYMSKIYLHPGENNHTHEIQKKGKMNINNKEIVVVDI